MSNNIESHLVENRVFPPDPAFAKRAHISSFAQYEQMYRRSINEPEAFWADMANEHLVWHKPWNRVLEWNAPFAKWFVGGKLNVSENCLDRHVGGVRRNKAALIWEGEPGDKKTLTYQQLYREVCKFANVLRRNHIQKGDRIIIYMPMCPEAAIAMLACTRIGAIHSVIFGGFSATAIRDRIQDSGARLIVTADGGYRRGAIVPLKRNVDEALKGDESIEKVIVFRRANNEISIREGRDVWWHREMDYVDSHSEPVSMDSEDPLFILYTSGSTGKPKGILHTTAGYLLGATVTTKYVFDLRDEDIFWCSADIGWITGHTYVVYGTLCAGATVLMYEGAPNWPEPDRFWKLIEEYAVNIFYTAPTAIRAFIRWGDDYPNQRDLSSLRLLGTVGEPINPEAWMWYHNVIGRGRCPIVDTWWQTETGGHMITPFPGATTVKPGTATLPFFGVDAAVVDDLGKEVGPNVGGKLVIRKPWPSMLRSIWGDEQRYRDQYWSEIKGVYFTGDGARRDEDGNFWIVGRIDDVLNVAGHRLGTSEIESILVSHNSVAEAAVVGRPDELKGQAVVAFVTLKQGETATPELREKLRQHVSTGIGAIARPDDIRFTEALPKTRSGKIMRRLLKEIAGGGQVTGDTTTLEDFSVLVRLRNSEE
jgi:acetyl-CoA synthetase